MPTYIILMKLTDQGMRDIKNSPQRIGDAVKGLEAVGGKLEVFYSVMGEYDFVAVGECPSDEIASTFLMLLCSQGNVRTTTLKAFNREEFVEMIEKLP